MSVRKKRRTSQSAPEIFTDAENGLNSIKWRESGAEIELADPKVSRVFFAADPPGLLSTQL